MKTRISAVRNIFSVLLAGILITSCEKDKDKDAQDDLVGTWSTWAATFSSTVGDKTMTQYFIDSLHMTAEDAELQTAFVNTFLQQSLTGTITFKSDKTYTSDLGGQTDSGTWSLSNDRKTVTLTSTLDNIPVPLEVIKLTSDELELSFIQNGSEDLNEDNVPEIIVVHVNLKMAKI